ncbi:hypothetical protein CBL_14032 [Carabus blaptoides fortunei]
MSGPQHYSDADLKLFSISNWYDLFHAHIPKTIIINIPLDVLELLKDDDTDITSVEDNASVINFSSDLNRGIVAVGGTAFLKNNWHAPQDASMFSLGHLLKVTNPKEALLFLCCSEIICADFARNSDISFCVALRPWMDLHPATEMRCIVVHNTLVGITPRDWPRYFSHFEKECDNIIKETHDFFTENIDKFPAKHYIFDIVLNEKVILWDFGPLNNTTELYAFDWDEIKKLIENEPKDVPPVFRYVAEETLVLQQTKPRLFYPNRHYLNQ